MTRFRGPRRDEQHHIDRFLEKQWLRIVDLEQTAMEECLEIVREIHGDQWMPYAMRLVWIEKEDLSATWPRAMASELRRPS